MRIPLDSSESYCLTHTYPPERPLELITYDEKKKIVYVPVVNNEGQVTNKNILYQLKDDYFDFVAIETGKRK